MRRLPGRPLVLGILALLGAGACLGCRSSSATRHHVLNPAIATPSPGTSSAGTLRVVGIGPVSLPAYLDRPQVVMRTAPDDIEVREFDQWGEPLRDGITRVVAVNVARLLPESLVVVFPWRSTERIRYQIVVEVTQMDGPAGGNVTLDARWRLLDAAGKQVVARAVHLSEPAGPSAATTASAMSRAIGTLSRDIADELRATEGWRA
jgi:uncharacterized lipoprotein YmbA